MSERKSLSGGDWLALGTFFVGAAVAVLVTYGLWTGVGGAAGTGAMAAAIAGFVGPYPALIGGVCVAFLGARAFLDGDRRRLLPSLLGVLGVAAGLSVVAGSLSGERGGTLGALTGGRVALMTHAAVGILLGAIVAFAAAYLAWMREDPSAAAKLAPARRATPAPPKSDDGVTAAESAMLFPAARAPAVDEDEVAPARPIAPPSKPAKPLYPEDVRLKGEIPAGTRPLTGAGVSALAATTALPEVPEPAVYRWTAPRADPTRMAPEEIEALADVAPPIPEPEPEVVVLASVALDAVDDLDATDERPMPPRPTWETTGLAEDDEPVDAYGTPLSLVERARRDRDDETEAPVATARIPREIGALSDAQAEVEAELAEETEALELEPVEEADVLHADEPLVFVAPAVETEVEAGDAPVAVAAVPEEEVPAAPRSLLEELRASNAAARAEAELDEEMDELEAEVTAVAEDPDAEMVDAIDALEDDEILEEAPAEPVMAVDTEEEEAEEPEPIETPEPVVAVAEEVEEEPEEEAEVEAPAPAPAPRAKPAVAASKSLFDAVEPEREHVLQPQAAVPASRAEKAPGRGIDPEKKLLVEVGCMFVERGRVAVSMLQRQYDMDFDQACRVLDDLQEMGLIGPYMGGKNREILLTKEQWLDKVGAAAS